MILQVASPYIDTMKSILILSFSLFVFGTASGQNLLAEHHFESEGITAVFVVGKFCDIHVSQGDQVVFDGRITGSGKEGDYIIASIRNGSQVLFELEKATSGRWNSNLQEARFNITMPEGVTLNIDNTSGDIHVSGLEGGDYQISASSGDVSMEDIIGTTQVKTTSGDLQVKRITGDLVMHSTSGDQQVRDITGSMSTRSSSGDMAIQRVRGDLKARASSGDIEFEEIRGAINVETTSGDITGRDITLTGDSEVNATSGDVSIRFTNDLEEIGFALQASSGDIEVGSIAAEDELMLNRGKFSVTGVTTSGDQEYH